jgi:hypothetical protein
VEAHSYYAEVDRPIPIPLEQYTLNPTIIGLDYGLTPLREEQIITIDIATSERSLSLSDQQKDLNN